MLYTSKIILKIAIFLTVIIFAINFIACGDDAVIQQNNTQTVDTVGLYEWSVDTLYGTSLNDLYVADSNNIYFSGSPPIFYNGQMYSEININDPSFFCYSVSGFDKNTAYFGGISLGLATIKKWNGGSVESYILSNDYIGSVNDILVLDYDNVWISVSEKNYIYHFVAGTITPYELSIDSVRGNKFYLGLNGEIYLFASEFSNDTIYTYSYKFVNNNFTALSIVPTCGTCNLYYTLGICNYDVLNITGYKVHYFNGIDWSIYIDAPKNLFNTAPSRVGGISMNEFLCYYSDGYPYVNSILIYKNNRWYWEKKLKFIGSYFNASKIISYSNRVYVLIQDIDVAYVAKGILKE